jgi:hypothetical protein
MLIFGELLAALAWLAIAALGAFTIQRVLARRGFHTVTG